MTKQSASFFASGWLRACLKGYARSYYVEQQLRLVHRYNVASGRKVKLHRWWRMFSS
jgi:hypothetical protein